jgi:transcriptional regulator GlxA family with amidase domain
VPRRDAFPGRRLRSQSAKGAIIVGVCAGAKVVASVGLLEGRRATTHRYYRKERLARHPTIPRGGR